MTKIYRALGTMSGTSLDGIDFSIIQTDGEDHLSLAGNKYLKFLINSVPTPSKEEVEAYYYENEAELFVNKKTGEPFGLVSSYGSVEAILLKEKQEKVQSKFFDSLNGDIVVLNKRWLYVD